MTIKTITKSILALIVLVVLIILGVKNMKQDDEIKPLKIAFGSAWNSIHPGLQHTLAGDLTLSNQFEALVSFNQDGTYVPLAAKEWFQSDDYRKLIFKIDTSRKFSDGAYLSAQHYKDSWENALKLEPKSANKSALDVLYKVEGFKDFEKSGKLTGIQVINNETLEIRFVTPFRMALEHLGGNRFSAYKDVNGKFLGTGAYVMEEIESDHLRLTPNLHHPAHSKNQIELSVVTTEDSIQALLDGKIDVLAYGIGGSLPVDFEKYKNLSLIVGQDALHRAIYLNSNNNRLFHKKEFRQALQYLSMKYYKNNVEALGNRALTNVDPQVYLPLQGGRLDNELVEQKVNQGKKYVDEFRQAAKANPLILFETVEYSLRPMLQASEIELSSKSKILSRAEMIAEIYKGDQADLMPGRFGVASGDPDGMYHLLGEKGAIKPKMISNRIVSDALEEGRKIIHPAEVDPFYKKVNLTILDEAPIIHLGFNKSVAIYRNDIVNVRARIMRRNAGHLHIFEPK